MIRLREGPLAVVALPIGALLIVAASCSLSRDGRVAAPESGQIEQAAVPARSNITPVQPAATFVANPFCKACHADFDDEQFALAHKAAGIGCERCHGESLRHRSDEANVTPPELMYPKERINPTCMMCHPRQTIRAVDEHRPILEAGLSIFETAPANESSPKYCTDCHGSHHRMKVRTIRWDKCTGKRLR